MIQIVDPWNKIYRSGILFRASSSSMEWQINTFGSCGIFSTKSSYLSFFSVQFKPWEGSWRSWAPRHCKFSLVVYSKPVLDSGPTGTRYPFWVMPLVRGGNNPACAVLLCLWWDVTSAAWLWPPATCTFHGWLFLLWVVLLCKAKGALRFTQGAEFTDDSLCMVVMVLWKHRNNCLQR